ncbi:phosphotransferase [Oleispirillum naphthae]|uniref:phosphotransferase n=1 Tax=Oleispirillum naphthae TaxID=2838853 RepID=UPI0030825B60
MRDGGNRDFSVVDAGGLAAAYAVMGEEEAAEVAAALFGLSGRPSRLATEKDDTFRIDAEGGRRYILKVANPTEAPAELELQVLLLRHIARQDPEIPVPRLIPDARGRACPAFTDRAGQTRRVRLMTFLEGAVLDATETSPAERERIGEVLARLRLATASFAHPAENRVLAWDVKHLAGLHPLLEAVESPLRKSLLTEGMERFRALSGRIAALRTQVLHNDFSRSNLVVDHARPEFVTGIIDFGDAVRTAVAIDVSTALLNQLPRDAAQHPAGDLFAAGRDLLRGYLRVAGLTEEELRLIPHLVMGRAVARALLSLWRARRFPGNAAYILRNTEQGWAQLEWLLARTPEALSELLLSEGSSS